MPALGFVTRDQEKKPRTTVIEVHVFIVSTTDIISAIVDDKISNGVTVAPAVTYSVVQGTANGASWTSKSMDIRTMLTSTISN